MWYLSSGVSKPLFAGLPKAFATAVGAGPRKRVLLLLDNAGFHTRPGLDVLDGIRLVASLDALVDTIGARCCDLAERQSELSSRTNFAWWPEDRTPS